jgi:hypothetical protein
LKRKKRKHCARIGSPRVQLTAANQEWALDFAHDVVAAGRTIRVLSVVDAFTRECLALEVDTGFASRYATGVHAEMQLRQQRGSPSQPTVAANTRKVISRASVARCRLMPMRDFIRSTKADASSQNLFTGTIAKAANLIAIVLGAYAFVHGEPSAKKIISPMVEIAVFIGGY